MHRVSHEERRVVVSIVKQHSFEAPGWTVYEYAQLTRVTGDTYSLE